MKTISFAHLADIHLGSFREKKLKELNLNQFRTAISIIIENNYDFVLISGDIFNVPLPPLEYVDSVIFEMNRLKERGIKIFVIGGSHDYSLTHKSFIEILDSAGVWKNVGKWQLVDPNSIELLPTSITMKGLDIDIYGVLGKKNGLDSKLYSKIKSYSNDKKEEKKERENSFHIFMFHSTILELLPNHLKKVNEKTNFAYSQSILPKGFNYYAGGHIHHPTIQKITNDNIQNNSYISYPGPIFPNSFSELKDKFSGFNECIIHFDEKSKEFTFLEPKYITLPLINIISIHIVCSMLSIEEIFSKLQQECISRTLKDSIVLIELSGEISGRATELNLQGIVNLCYERNAYLVLKNTQKVKQKEQITQHISYQFSTVDELHTLAIEKLTEFETTELNIKIKKEFAQKLLQSSYEKHEDETQYHYEERVIDCIKKICKT